MPLYLHQHLLLDQRSGFVVAADSKVLYTRSKGLQFLREVGHILIDLQGRGEQKD